MGALEDRRSSRRHLVFHCVQGGGGARRSRHREERDKSRSRVSPHPGRHHHVWREDSGDFIGAAAHLRSRHPLHAVEVGVRVAVGDAAHVLEGLHLEVAVGAPREVPGVLDGPVGHVQVDVRAVADREHGVVHVHGAVLADGRRVDARRIGLEVRGDLERDRDGARRRERHLELLLVSRRQINGTARHDDADALRLGHGRVLGHREGAVLRLGDVRVRELGRQAARVLDVLEGVRRQPAVAARRVEVEGAVDELLLGKPRRAPRVGLEREVRLKSADRRERPARPARALVLHLAHDAALAPVERVGNILEHARAELGLELRRRRRRRAVLRFHEDRVLELIPRPVRELVDAHLPRELRRVVRLDLRHLRLEDGAADGLLASGVVAAEHALELLEVHRPGRQRGGDRGQGEQRGEHGCSWRWC
mmetsp:Transcript_9638/g.39298  ORF Transcript_9638/g.39298 Transcript_9638/m.39298 type:complete len:422 (-) Transcript_9638:36-1301(-)